MIPTMLEDVGFAILMIVWGIGFALAAKPAVDTLARMAEPPKQWDGQKFHEDWKPSGNPGRKWEELTSVEQYYLLVYGVGGSAGPKGPDGVR